MPQAVAIAPSKLIEVAEELANHMTGAGRPRPAWLRRAVSTAYYALFHCICLEAARHLLPNGEDEERLMLARTFGHAEIKEARHRADYDHLAAFPKATAIAHIEDAKRSIEQVCAMPPRERELFFSLVALRARAL